MKINIKNKTVIILSAIVFVFSMCVTITEITFPGSIATDSDFTTTVKFKFEGANGDNTKVIFGVLVPKIWNVKGANPQLLLTTKGASSDVSGEVMTLVGDAETEPTTATPWSTAIQTEFGLFDNFGEVEWVVFESQTQFVVADGDNADATVQMTLHAGGEAIKYNMAILVCGKTNGFHSEYFESNSDNPKSATMTMEVPLGADLADFTLEPAVSTTPSAFGFGDIFSINFQARDTSLEGEDNIYLVAKAVMLDGNTIIVDEISDQTLMNRIGESTSYYKYIFPKELFGLDDVGAIQSINVRLQNSDGSVVVNNSSTGTDFEIIETCE